MSKSQVAIFLIYFFTIFYYGNYSYGQDQISIDDIPIRNYTIHDYDINDGLRQMQVNDIFVSTREEIWIGTRAGVCLFDGENFDCFEDLDIKPDYVYDIGEMNDGRIVILASKHLYFFDGNRFTKIDLPSDIMLLYPTNIRTDLLNRIWINRRHSKINLIYKDENLFEYSDLYPDLAKLDINTIWPSVSGDTIYFISENKYLQSINEGIVKTLYESKTAIAALNEYWYTPSNSLNRIKDFIVLSENNNDLNTKLVVVDLRSNLKDTLYKGGKVVAKFNHSLFKKKEHVLSIENGNLNYVLKDAKTKYNQVLSLLNHEKVNYIGTDKGLLKCTPSLFTNYSEEKFSNIWTISEMPDGEIYFNSYSGKMIRLSDEKEIKNYNSVGIGDKKNSYIFGSNRRFYFTSFMHKDGNLYLTHQKGLMRYDGNEITHFYPKNDIMSTMPSLYLYHDVQKNIFFRATCPGVDIIDYDAKLLHNIDTTLFSHTCILTINQTEENLYWFGATGGIASYNYDNSSVVNYEFKNGRCPLNRVICSHIDKDGNFWIGGIGGLARYDIEKDSFLLVEELYNYNVNSIIQGNDNQLFLATIRGLLMIDPQAYLSDGIMRSRLFTAKDGMEAIELNQNGFFKDSKGQIWTTSATNVVSFDPQQLQYKQVKLNPKIYKINGQRITYNKDTVIIEQGKNSIYVNYGLSDDKNNIDILYRCRLDNDNWSDWTNNLINRYVDLSSGLHNIKVEAKNITDPNAICFTESVDFKIDIALHQEPYYSKLLGMLILLSLIILVFLLLMSRRIYNRYRSANHALQLAQFNNEELRNLNTTLSVQLEAPKNNPTVSEDQIEIKGIDKVHLVDRNNLIYFSAEDNGTRINVADNSFWSPLKFKEVQSRIGNEKFVQIFRSTVINITKIKWINHSSLMMQNDDELKIGRTYKSDIQRLLK